MKQRSSMSEYTRQVLTDVKNMEAEELLTVHGIEIREDGSIYDQAYNQTFRTINDWIDFAENDEDSEFEKFGGHDDYADDY